MSNDNRTFTLNDLVALMQALQEEKDRVRAVLAEIDQELAGVATVMRLLQERLGLPEVRLNVTVDELRGKSQLDALLTIARKNNNRLKVTDARHLLIQAELLKSTKSAPAIVYTVIQRSGQFERVGLGEYKLIEEENKPEENSAVTEEFIEDSESPPLSTDMPDSHRSLRGLDGGCTLIALFCL